MSATFSAASSAQISAIYRKKQKARHINAKPLPRVKYSIMLFIHEPEYALDPTQVTAVAQEFTTIWDPTHKCLTAMIYGYNG